MLLEVVEYSLALQGDGHWEPVTPVGEPVHSGPSVVPSNPMYRHVSRLLQSRDT